MAEESWDPVQIKSKWRRLEDTFRDISTAKRIIEKSSSTSKRTPRIQTNMPGRPSYDIPQEQVQSLIGLGFKVPQISELLHVSTRTVEWRLAEYSITARSYSSIMDEELGIQVQDTETRNTDQILSLDILHLVTSKYRGND